MTPEEFSAELRQLGFQELVTAEWPPGDFVHWLTSPEPRTERARGVVVP
jgi:hypothetical protein